MPQACISVNELGQVGEARRAVSRMAQELGFDETVTGRAALVATELSTNLARHARDGRLMIQAVESAGRASLEMISIDGGPGIADMQRCLQDGYSTGGTPGNGLGAIRRQSSLFDFYSTEGRGTAIVSRISPQASSPSPLYRWGAVSLNAPSESVCGDAWAIAETDTEIAVMLADGLGHGPLANEAASRAQVAFRVEPFADLAQTVERSHRALLGSRGAAMALARVTSAEIRYAGVGNIAGVVMIGDGRAGLMTQNGTVGVQLRRIQEVRQPWSARFMLIMHSDGLTHRWSLDAYPGLVMRHPAVIAAVLSRDFLRGRDDATVVVVSAQVAEHSHG